MSPITIIREHITRAQLEQVASELFGDMVKAVVDCKQEIIAIGGELHADEEQILLEQGSKQEDLWGINLYPDDASKNWIEFDSMINIRPSQNNRSRGVEDPALQECIRKIVTKIVQ